MKRRFFALAASLVLHAVVFLAVPFPKPTPPQIIGYRRAVTIALADLSGHNNEAAAQLERGVAGAKTVQAIPPSAPVKIRPKTSPTKSPGRKQVPSQAKGRTSATPDIQSSTSPEARPPQKAAPPPPAVNEPQPPERTAPSSDTTTGAPPRHETPTDNADAAGDRTTAADKTEAMGDAVGTTEAAEIRAVPLYRQNPSPAYPRRARLGGVEGRVLIDVLVGEDGAVRELKIGTSSGHRILDRAALKAVRTWRFTPGRRGPTPVAMWVKVPVRFKLQ